MENTGPSSSESETLKKSSGSDDNREERSRNFITYAAGVAGGVTLLVAQFGLLPEVTLAEKLLTFFSVIGLTGAIISGIGAWRSIRRFTVMLIFFGTVLSCAVGIAIAATRSAAPKSASGPIISPSVRTPSTSSPPVASPGAGANSSSSGSNQGSSSSENSAAGPGYTTEYTGKEFSLPGDECSDTDNEPYVHFASQSPLAVGNYYGDLMAPAAPWDLYLDCLDSEIVFEGSVAGLPGNPSAEACENQINSNPLTGTYAFSRLRSGTQFCLLGTDGTNVVYIKLLSVSDSSFTTKWAATAWSIPSSS
jgi:hypothetical protein